MPCDCANKILQQKPTCWFTFFWICNPQFFMGLLQETCFFARKLVDNSTVRFKKRDQDRKRHFSCVWVTTSDPIVEMSNTHLNSVQRERHAIALLVYEVGKVSDNRISTLVQVICSVWISGEQGHRPAKQLRLVLLIVVHTFVKYYGQFVRISVQVGLPVVPFVIQESFCCC